MNVDYPGGAPPPGHCYVAVSSKMSIPNPVPVEQVAIILMKAQKALQQLTFQWVVLNRPAHGIGFVMFWDGGDLADDGYAWQSRGRRDCLTMANQKSINIEALRFFDGYTPGDRYVTMTKTFYRFANQQTCLYFVHYLAHPADAPAKPISGPPIPTTKPSNLDGPDLPGKQPMRGRRGGIRTPPPILLAPPGAVRPAVPASATPQPESRPSPTTIRLSMPTHQAHPQQSQPPPRISPKRGRPPGSSRRGSQREPALASPRDTQKSNQQQNQNQQDVIADLDTWGPVEQAVNRLTRIDAFYAKLFNVTTGIKEAHDEGLAVKVKAELVQTLSNVNIHAKPHSAPMKRDDRFDQLEQASTEQELLNVAALFGLTYTT